MELKSPLNGKVKEIKREESGSLFSYEIILESKNLIDGKVIAPCDGTVESILVEKNDLILNLRGDHQKLFSIKIKESEAKDFYLMPGDIFFSGSVLFRLKYVKNTQLILLLSENVEILVKNEELLSSGLSLLAKM